MVQYVIIYVCQDELFGLQFVEMGFDSVEVEVGGDCFVVEIGFGDEQVGILCDWCQGGCLFGVVGIGDCVFFGFDVDGQVGFFWWIV